MGLFLRQDDQRSEVQKRVATELLERLRQTTPVDTGDHDPSMLEHHHTTRNAGMIIIVLLLLLFIAVVVFAIRIS